ncbi:MAG: hypothetical protein U0835_26015 [Isosphaeraceae bacterium]
MDGLRFQAEDRGRSSSRDEAPRRPRRSSSLRVEGLEGRELLSGVVADIASLPAGSTPSGPVTVVNGNLWAGESSAGGAKLDKITPSGFRTQVALPSGANADLSGLTSDASGNVWYALDPKGGGTPTVGKVKADGTVAEFPVGSAGSHAGTMTFGNDGNVWVSVKDAAGASLVKVKPDGTSTSYPVTGAKSLDWLEAGPDGNIWYVNGSKLGKMTPTGDVTEYPVPTPADGSAVDLSNAQLTSAADGNLWFIGLGGVARITPWGDVKAYPTRSASVTSLSTAVDGNLWLSFLPPAGSGLDYSPNAVLARLTTDGRMSILPDRPDGPAHPVTRMASGHDTGLWLGEPDGSFSRANLAGVPTVTPPIIRPTTKSTLTAPMGAELTGTVVSFVPNAANANNAIPQKFTAVIEWGDGGSSVGSVVPNGQGGYNVVGTHSYEVKPGMVQSVRVTVSNLLGDAAVIFNQITVLPPIAGTTISNDPVPAPVNPTPTTPTTTPPSSGTTTPTPTPTPTPTTNAGGNSSTTGSGSTTTPTSTTTSTSSGSSSTTSTSPSSTNSGTSTSNTSTGSGSTTTKATDTTTQPGTPTLAGTTTTTTTTTSSSGSSTSGSTSPSSTTTTSTSRPTTTKVTGTFGTPDTTPLVSLGSTRPSVPTSPVPLSGAAARAARRALLASQRLAKAQAHQAQHVHIALVHPSGPRRLAGRQGMPRRGR